VKIEAPYEEKEWALYLNARRYTVIGSRDSPDNSLARDFGLAISTHGDFKVRVFLVVIVDI
jgi:hypothetical protein